MTTLKNLNNVLKLLGQFVLLEIPSRDTFARLQEDATVALFITTKFIQTLEFTLKELDL